MPLPLTIRRVAGLVFIQVIVSAPYWALAAPATPNAGGPKFPDTHAGRVAEAFVKAFNSGDDGQMRTFESKHRSKAALAKRSIDDRITQFRELRDKWGRLEVRTVVGDQNVSFVAHTSASDEWLNLSFELESAVPHGLEGIRIEVMSGEPSAEAMKPLDAAARKEAVEAIASTLDRVYVFPEIGKKMADLVRKRAADGAYDQATAPAQFAAKVMEDLRSVCPDKHLGFRAGAAPRPREGVDPDHDLIRQGPRENYGFVKTEILAGNVGYVKFNMFTPGKAAEETAAAAMNFVANADALVFDLRDNGGGSPEMIAFLSGYLFDKKVHLNSFYNREEEKTEEWWSREDAPGRRFGEAKPVYVLTSGHTFSGAEEFTYNLKNLKRATIIGETTGGGAHPVSAHDVAGRFTLMVPFARAINPITKTNWEGTGVAPDVRVAAADALDAALKAAREKLAKGKQ